VLQPPLNFSDDHLDRDRVVSPPRHNYVRVALARLDKLEMHRLHRRQVLLDDFVDWSSPNMRVALDSTDDPNIRVRVDEHLHVA
jgi:hypothetical protein